jgi:hypothetical protein
VSQISLFELSVFMLNVVAPIFLFLKNDYLKFVSDFAPEVKERAFELEILGKDRSDQL